MFRASVLVSSVDDVDMELGRLSRLIESSGIPASEANYLREQVEVTARQFERQLTMSTARIVNAERVFQGRNFRVRLLLRPKRDSFLGRLRALLGYSQRSGV